MEGSIITFARLGLLSKELVGLTIKDPRILTLATVDKRLLPCYMPLVCNSEYEYCLCVSKAMSVRLLIYDEFCPSCCLMKRDLSMQPT